MFGNLSPIELFLIFGTLGIRTSTERQYILRMDCLRRLHGSMCISVSIRLSANIVFFKILGSFFYVQSCIVGFPNIEVIQ